MHMHYNQLFNDICSPELKCFACKDIQQPMHMHYNQQKEKQSFVD